MTEDLLTTFNISLVVRGSVSETGAAEEEQEQRYSKPKQKGIMRWALPESASQQCKGSLCRHMSSRGHNEQSSRS